MSLTRDKDTNVIKSLKTGDVVFSYAFLTSPRPEGSLNPGTYGAELIISDEETKKEVMEYLKQMIEDGKKNTWKGKIPKDLYIPVRDPDEENEHEKDALIVLKTSTKIQPKLYIRDPETGRAHNVEEDEEEEIYSGMVGEAIIRMVVVDFKGFHGIKAYINAACKTADGTPFGSVINYEDEFSEDAAYGSEFDAVKETKTTKPKKTTKKEPEPEEDEDDVDLDSLIKKGSSKTSKEPDEETIDSLDDLLKRKV
jgi:hypothetical protein